MWGQDLEAEARNKQVSGPTSSLSRLWRATVGSLEADGNLDSPGVGLAVPSRRPGPRGCRAAPLPTRKPGAPACLWEGLECPPAWPLSSAQTPRRSFSFGAEGERMGKGDWWKDGAAGRLRPRTRPLQLTPRSFLCKCFRRGCLFFFFFFSFLQEGTSALGLADPRASGQGGADWALRSESRSPQLLQDPGGKQQTGTRPRL